MKVVCVSDTHGLHENALTIPPGDIFVHAGDFTDTGKRSEVLAFNEFLGRLPHRYKLVIAGNHESSFDRQFYPEYWHQYGHKQQYDPTEVRALLTNALYLEDQAVLIEGYLFYGTPWQPEFCNWAFNLPRGDALLRQWRLIPTDTDVLVTHTPPMGHGDLVGFQRVGCADLLREVENRVRPKLHVFGHVHEGYGRSVSSDGKITYLNASTCTHDYEPVNPPLVFELTGPPKRGWSNHSLSLTTPLSMNNSSIRRSFSSNGVSNLSGLLKTDDGDIGTDTGLPDKAQPKDYDLMLHAWLRLCSHKPQFLERQEVETCESNETKNLWEFRVDGTTSGLLFESTLKLRPVTNVQKRVLRYLFSQGFRNNSDNYMGLKSQTDVVQMKQDEVAIKNEDDCGVRKPTKERQKYGISRRVTVAVLDGIDEGKEGMYREHVQQARVAAASLSKSGVEGADVQSRRLGRNKTLQRRSAVPKLASLTEEPSEGEAYCASSASTFVQGENPNDNAAVSKAIVTTSRVVECVLCKYKVSGHTHPGVQPTPPPALAETSSESNEEGKKPSKSRSEIENPPFKRLSSWF
ncbi:unnamed protein product [Peronospora farinosa]|uniref:Calcineurin-like phosphoesterase domain-containing protein n=1 Tax=Peronospora farinosa TaxID=134698 RepID=A0AAV0UIM8_9STRA|nr:unnamed protein product [Peronospora farinosa]CAI5736769.1 unnamed protein product [Peronospora farinosa]